MLDGADVRYFAVDGVEVIRRIYVTVRDADWDIPPLVSLGVECREARRGFLVRSVAEQRSATATVAWEVTAELLAHGALNYRARIMPQSSFRYSRIGLCVLHPPATCAGQPYRASGGARNGVLPKAIAPQLVDGAAIFPLFEAFGDLEIDVSGLGPCRFSFEGDLFEMEDQRNWSDGSFKTYCTPLSVPRPHQARPGAAVEQAVRVTTPTGHALSTRTDGTTVELSVGSPCAQPFPAVGLGLGAPLAGATADAVRELAPEHLRADLRHPNQFDRVLAQAQSDSELAGCPLILALHLGAAEPELDQLRDRLERMNLAVCRLLVFSREQPASTGPLVRLARDRLAPLFPHACFAGGTDIWFVDLNRGRPDPASIDGVAWSVTPGVHADDELTMIEGLEAQSDQAATAATFVDGLDLLPGPITLRPRYNPNAADAAQQALHFPETSLDPRQGSAFAAAWTSGSLRAQAIGGVRAVTYFETAGPRGVVAENGSRRFPCWLPLAWAARRRGFRVFSTTSSAPLRAQALIVAAPDSARSDGLVVNLTGAPLRARVRGIPMECVEPSRAARATRNGDALELELAAWDVACVRSA